MAVVQISRIQQRRGRKNTGTGFPQLASGEIGWAIDTQELYIGNGAVSEGAPYVGNTQILTEHVNILDFAEAYTYQRNNPIMQTGPSPYIPVQRTLQERFDERVDVKSFGALGNGVTDDTESIQRAIDQLYLNDATKNNTTTRVILYFGPGEYVISEEIRIPAYCHLLGSGIDSTIIHFTGTGANGFVMRTVDSQSTPGNYTEFASMQYSERPRFINIEKLTLQTDLDDTIFMLDNADTIFFKEVKFLGMYDNGGQPVGEDPVETIKQTAVYSRSTSGIHRPENVYFDSCIFNKTGYGFYSKTDHNNIGFYNCQFYQLYDGIQAGGDVYGSINTKVTDCYFDLVDRYGIWIKKGYGNTSTGNKFMLVGNNNLGYAGANVTIIRFDPSTPDTLNQKNPSSGQSINDYFERNTRLKDQTEFGLIPFYPNVRSSAMVADPTNFIKRLENTPSEPIEFFRFPLYKSATYIIDYVINKTTLGPAVRSGQIHLTVNFTGIKYHIEDNYTFTGSSTVENIEFFATLEDLDGDLTRETLILRLFNPTGNGVGFMNYSYRMMTE